MAPRGFYIFFAIELMTEDIREENSDLFSGKLLKIKGLGRICRSGTRRPLPFYSAFQIFFDFPQHSGTLRHRTIHTVRTNRIIL